MFTAKSLKCITSVNIVTVQSITFIFEKKKNHYETVWAYCTELVHLVVDKKKSFG